MFLKFICKAFFAKNIVKSVGNSGINGRSSLPVLFPGQSTTFRQNKRPFSGKPGGPTGTNTAGKNDLLRGQNKVERNCRHAQGTQQIKSRSCRTVFLCGSFCFSVLICTPNTGCRAAWNTRHLPVFSGFLGMLRTVRPVHPHIKYGWAKPAARKVRLEPLQKTS